MTPRIRELGLIPGIFPPGPLNAITDVDDVRVGQVTLIEGDNVRTGVTAILPHPDNLYQDKVPAGLAVGNGYGKLTGSTQIIELGEIETPILLTNTLAVPRAAEAIIDWTLSQPGNEQVHSVNPVVGETNDGRLNDIRRRALTVAYHRQALESAQPGPVEEGNAGAGTGTVAFGWKGGIGTSSRQLTSDQGGYVVGTLVQANFGGELRILGMPVDQEQIFPKGAPEQSKPHHMSTLRKDELDGSIMIVIATDAPLSDRNLTRLARRAMAGLARTGAAFSNGSGDYAIAFSTSLNVRRTPERRKHLAALAELPNDRVSPLFQAAIEATEEAIYNALFQAETMSGHQGVVEALPVEKTLKVLKTSKV